MEEQEVRYVFNDKIYNITKSEKLYEYRHKEKTNMLLLGQYPTYRDVITKVYKSRRGNFFMRISSNGRISIKDITIDEFLKILTERNELDLLKSIFPSEYNKLQEV